MFPLLEIYEIFYPKKSFLASLSSSEKDTSSSSSVLDSWSILTHKNNAIDTELLKQTLQEFGINDSSQLKSCSSYKKLAVLADCLKTSRWGDIDPESTLTYSGGRGKGSLIELLRREFPDSSRRHPELDVSYDEAVDMRANKFVSFAYSDNFVDLVGSLEQFLVSHPQFSEELTYFWVDLMVNNQWIATSKSFTWWASTFREAFKCIGHTVCFFSSYNKPTITTRAWSLFEMYCSAKTDCAFEVTMSEDDKGSFF